MTILIWILIQAWYYFLLDKCRKYILYKKNYVISQKKKKRKKKKDDVRARTECTWDDSKFRIVELQAKRWQWCSAVRSLSLTISISTMVVCIHPLLFSYRFLFSMDGWMICNASTRQDELFYTTHIYETTQHYTPSSILYTNHIRETTKI
jgi:hypothetical protein